MIAASPFRTVEAAIVLTATVNGEPAVGGGPAAVSDVIGSILTDNRNSIVLAILLVGIVLGLALQIGYNRAYRVPAGFACHLLGVRSDPGARLVH